MNSVHLILSHVDWKFTVVVILLLILIKGVCKMSAATDAYNASVTQLTTDVETLITDLQGGSQAAVDAFATSAKATIDNLDATVKAAIPAPPPAG